MSERTRLANAEDERVAQLARQLAETKAALQRESAERRRLEGLLAERQLDFQLIVESISLPVAVTTPSGDVEALNRPTLEYFGLTLETLKGWAALDVVHPDDLQRTVTEQREAHAAGRSYNIESRHRRADGVYRWFNVLGLPLRDTDGRVLRWLHLLIDIDDRKRAEAALNLRERNAHEAIDGIPGLVGILAADGSVEIVNRPLRDYSGRTLEELKQWGSIGIVHDDDLAHTAAVFARAIATGTPYENEQRLRRHDGEFRWFQNRGVPVRDHEGRIARWYILLTDIEERKRAETAQQRSELNARLLVDNIPAFVSILSPKGALESVNQQLLDYSGQTLEQLQQWPTTDLFHAEDRARALTALHHAIETGEPFNEEIRIRRADGVYRWFQIRGFAPRDVNGDVIRWYTLHADIDDRKRAEQALAASERDLKLNIDTIPTLTWSARQDGTDFHYNKHYLDYVGLPPEGIRGRRWTKQIHPDDLDGLLEAWDAALDAGVAGEAEARLLRHDGVYRWFLFRVNPFHDENGAITKWYGVNIDIEDRKRAEAELVKASLHLNQAQQLSRTGSYIVDFANNVHVCSDEFYRICEFELGSPISTRALESIVAPEDQPILARTMERATAGEPADFEFRILTKSGAVKHLHGIARRISDGPVFAGAVIDITERKDAEARLRRSDGFLAKAQELSLTGSFSWSSAAPRAFTWSEQMYRLYEFPMDSPITADVIQERYHPDDRSLLAEALKRARSGEPIDYEHRLLFADGRIKHVHVFATMAPRAGEHIEYFGAVQDVTQRRMAAEALEKVRAELAHAARAMSLGTLTASIAHEVNQPLSGIITNANTCLRMLAADPPNIEGALETARRTIRDGNRASEVIKRLRALFGKKEFVNEPVDLNAATREVIALSWPELQRHGVVLQVSFEDDLPQVAGDRVQLQQVIINLLLNATDAMKEVDERPRQIIVQTSRRDDANICLSVRDTGVGVTEDGLKKLFDAFYTTKLDGMGIGLSVSRSIIERHEGRLWATQNEGPGATFSFVIPCGNRP